MKKLLILLFTINLSLIFACNGAHEKTGDDKPDSAANHTNASGASDTINGSAAPFAESTSGTDTSTNGQSVDDPLADTVKPKKHH